MSEFAQQEAFLSHVSKKLGRSRRSGVTPPEWKEKPYQITEESPEPSVLIKRFIDNLKGLNAGVHWVSKAEVTSTFVEILTQNGIKSAVYWDDERLHQLQLKECLTELGIENRAWDTAASEEDMRSYAARANLGITFADMGLAETGSVVLFNGGGKGRLVSLLPPVYLVVLSERTIYQRLTQGVLAIRQQLPNGLPACINFITGPSRTGDIEMDLAVGVHGPGKVHVILLKD